MTDRERFEAWFAIELEKGSLYLADKEDCLWLWEAATLAERERCAELCEKSDRYRGDYFAIKIRGE